MKRFLRVLRGAFTALSVTVLTCASAEAATRRASVDASGRQGKGASFDGAMSADGRWVAFATTAKLLPEDQNGKTDVYLKDLETAVIRLVSDERGGDQPSMSADGRFIVYRALYAIPKVRFFDRDSVIDSYTVSAPFGSGNSSRPADNAVISADGATVAFVHRPSPSVPSNRDTRIVTHSVATLTSVDRVIASDVGRLAISGDGRQLYFESADALNVSDTNGAQDIYMNDQHGGGSNVALWVSRPDAGQSQSPASTSPAAVFDGGKVFFLSQGALSAADTDGRKSLYRADIAGSAVTLTFIQTSKEPLDLSTQASPRAEFIGFLAKTSNSTSTGFVRDLSSTTEKPIYSRYIGPMSAPRLSGDGSKVLLNTKSPGLVSGDTNGQDDVFVVDSPLGTLPNSPPVPVLNGVPANPVNRFANFNVNASATAGTAGLRFLSIDRDGFAIFTSNGTAIPSRTLSLDTGIYSLQARAIDQDWITKATAPATVTVLPLSNTAGITGVVSLVKTPQADGTTLLDATFRIDNRRGTPTAPLRLMIIESSTPTTMGPTFGDETKVPNRGQNVIGVADVGTLAAGGTTTASMSAVVSGTELVDDGFQGVGWIVTASLQEQSGQNFSQINKREIFTAAPLLEENTPGPNGGIAVFGTPNGDANFSPPTLQSIAISGAQNVAAGTQAAYKATATFSNGSTKPCNPSWSLSGTPGVATISVGGVLTAANTSTPKALEVRASLGGISATPRQVTIRPVTPVLAVRADVPRATESGTNGRLKVTRTPISNTALDVNYTVTGKAQNGVDYQQLTGTIQFPANTSRVFIEVTPVDDANFEGLESVTVTLEPSSTYRLSAAKRATINIADDEPFPSGAVDAAIKKGTAAPVGREVIDTFVFPPQFPPTQTLAANGTVNVASTFLISATNRDSVARTIDVSGALDAAGFTVRYFSGTNDVSAAVADQTLEFPDVQPGATVTLRLKITPTRSAATGSLISAITRFNSSGGSSDVVEAVVKRVR